MNKSQVTAIKNCLQELIEQANVDRLILFFHGQGAFPYNEYESLKNELRFQTKHDQAAVFFEKIKGNDRGWALLELGLKNANQTSLWQKLKDAEQAATSEPQVLKDVPALIKAYIIPKLWNVPQKNSNFTGRTCLLVQLKESFTSTTLTSNSQEITDELPSTSFQHPSNENQITVCYGLGGVGKTHLAIEFIYRNQDNYPNVFWFPAENSTQIQIAYQQLALDLDMDTTKLPNDAIVRKIITWFDEHPGCLLVYDNLPDSKTIASFLPLQRCHILITSRTTEFLCKAINVDVFTADDAIDYVRKILGDRFLPVEIDKLARLLGYLPLALSQACAYMKKNAKISIADYLIRYQDHQEKLLAHEQLPEFQTKSIIHQPVYVTWNITIEAIHNQSQLAAKLFRMCAYLESDQIPDYIFDTYLDNQANNPAKDKLDELQATLASYSMIKINPNKKTISIHRLVQQVIQLQMRKEKNLAIFAECYNLVRKCFPAGEKQVDYDKAIILIPHLESVINHFDKDLIPVKENAEKKKAEFLGYLGKAYRILGNYEKQLKCLEEAMIIDEKHHGKDHVRYAVTLVNLGQAHGNLGNYEKQLKCLEEGIIIKEKHYGKDHVEYAVSLANLGQAHGNMGNYEKQLKCLEEAIIIDEKHYGKDHVEYATTLNNLGQAHGNLGNYEKQLKCLEEAIIIKEKHYGKDHVEYAVTLNNLGRAHGNLGNYEKQLKRLEEAIIIHEKHYGKDHVEYAATLVNLGQAHGNLGNYEKQLKCLEEAIIIDEKHYGKDHVEYAITLNNLGRAHDRLGNYEKQLKCLKEAIIVFEKHYGKDHVRYAVTLNNLGRAHGNLGNYEKQLNCLEEAIIIDEKHYGKDHIEYAVTLNNLGRAHGRLGNYEKELNCLEEAIIIDEKHYGKDHIEYAVTLNNLGRAHGRLGNYEKELKCLEEAIIIDEKHYGKDHIEYAITLNNLGLAHGNMDNYEKQLKCLEEAMPIYEKHFGCQHEHCSTLRNHIRNAEKNMSNSSMKFGIIGNFVRIFWKNSK